MGLVAYPGRVRADRLAFAGHDLLDISDGDAARLTGKDVAMIFQEPTTSLNPCFTIGFQIAETLRLHEGMDRKAARRRAIELLAQVGIPEPERRLNAYPHQLSGGMNQRVMIAMAIACSPKLLIADEPTTALDVTIQAQILDLLLSLQRERGMALVLITHNMGVVAETAQRVIVMYAGQIMEEREARTPSSPTPQHPYTAALLAALPERSDRRPPPRHDSGRRAGPVRPAARLPLQPALRLRHRALRAGCAPSCAPGWAARSAATIRSTIPSASAPSRPITASARRRPRERPRRRGEDLVQALCDQPRPLPRPGRLQAVGGVTFAVERGADARGRRRIRLRQVDARPHGHPDRAADDRHAHSSTASTP